MGDLLFQLNVNDPPLKEVLISFLFVIDLAFQSRAPATPVGQALFIIISLFFVVLLFCLLHPLRLPHSLCFSLFLSLLLSLSLSSLTLFVSR